ncbi:DUF2786 domain-containing protein [Zhongshania sp.]|jgi:hypothetical protein|uniref:DUF2786 domain-containing protein n=1 Tax=Zhongshania sp. TaxID=1971902 RepID=UPI002A808416|nr:DUF2786 domain-containing protein [Zhongshania sp.]
MSNRERILDKIRKCLSLAESANEHEAAIAMRQAKKLMEANGLTASELGMYELTKKNAYTAFSRPPKWAIDLAGTVALAFSCSLYIRSGGIFIFVGAGAAPEISEYSYLVLYRQLDRARKQYAKGLDGCWYSPADRRQMGRAFCEGWIEGVNKTVRTFANAVTERQRSLHHEYMESLSNRKLGKGRQRKSAIDDNTYGAAQEGRNQGEKIQLHQGVAAGEQPLRIQDGAAC